MRRIGVARRIKQSYPTKMSGFTFDLPGFVKKLHRIKAEELFSMICEWRKIVITNKEFRSLCLQVNFVFFFCALFHLSQICMKYQSQYC